MRLTHLPEEPRQVLQVFHHEQLVVLHQSSQESLEVISEVLVDRVFGQEGDEFAVDALELVFGSGEDAGGGEEEEVLLLEQGVDAQGLQVEQHHVLLHHPSTSQTLIHRP